MTELTGRHVALLFVGGFGTVIAVNLALAVSAVRTFPGLEVANSYVASQAFEAERDAQDALGWTVRAGWKDGRLAVAITDRDGRPAKAQDLTLHVGRPTEARDDAPVTLGPDGTVPLELAPGLWRLDVGAAAPDGTRFSYRLTFRVPA